MLHLIFRPFSSFLSVALAVALVLGAIAPAFADNLYGDIAVSPSTGQTDFSRNFSSQSAADARAILRCNNKTNGVNDCRSQLEVHSHLCGAIAFDSAVNQWRGGRGSTIFEARGNALAALSTSNGSVAENFCNDTGNNNGSNNNGNFNNGSNNNSNNKYGAIAVSPNTLGSYGSWDFSSQSAADNRATSGCNGRSNGANDCQSAVIIHNQTCGALAEDTSQGTWKDGHGNSAAAANSDALARLNSSNGAVVRTICNNNSGSNSSNNTGNNNTTAGIIGLLVGAAAVVALTHHQAAATPAPTAAPAPVAVVAAPVAAAPVAAVPAPVAAAPPAVVAFGASHFGAIAVNAAGTLAMAALNRDSAANAMADAINSCNARYGGNGCTVHAQFGTSDALCGAVAIRHSAHENVIGSATASSEGDAEARALMKAGSGATILAHGCNTK